MPRARVHDAARARMHDAARARMHDAARARTRSVRGRPGAAREG